MPGQEHAELEALRSSLNPHFLFNTLNGISAMIVTRRLAEADELVHRLSAFLRAAIGGPAPPQVTIGEELAVVEHYARIEQFRFGARLSVALDRGGAAGAWHVPPLLVQALVAHAIEALSSADTPACLRVTAALDGARLRIVIDHPHMEMPERHLAAARARMSGWPGAELRRAPGATLLWLGAAGEGI